MSVHRIRPATANQLLEYAAEHQDKDKSVTLSNGIPLAENNASLTVGKRGVGLFQDVTLVEELAHFDRERIPERVVHAKGAGAYGYFQVTNDITRYTAAKVFAEIGKTTPLAVRFSQVTGEMGSADTVRDPRGFAIKFYTEDGAWDLVGNNTPIFFIRDSILFPSFIHVLKRNPVTHVRDPDMFWDFISLRPESTHQILILYSDRGIPDGYRHMHGYGSNTFSLVNKAGRLVYCKFHYLTNQGIRNIEANRATVLAGADPDYSLRDLYNAIASKRYPSWTMYIQVMTPAEAESCKFNPFDVTKTWPHADYPLIEVGKIVLDRNPSNYFAEVEQIALNPANMIPGIEPSPDRMLQGRLFSYGDTHRYRLGKNYNQLPVNSPLNRVHTYHRDGFATINSEGGAPIYHPNSFNGPRPDERAKELSPSYTIAGDAWRYDNGNEDNFTQARILYRRVLDDGAKSRLIQNLANDLRMAATFIQERQLENFAQVDADFARRITEQIQAFNGSQTLTTIASI